MIGEGIHDGDLLVVDRSLRPADGDVIIACVEISPERSELRQRSLRQRQGVLRFRGDWREIMEDEAAEAFQTRLDPLGRADNREVVVPRCAVVIPPPRHHLYPTGGPIRPFFLKKNEPSGWGIKCAGRDWRRGGDSNPRWTCAHTTFPRLHHRPLGHPSSQLVFFARWCQRRDSNPHVLAYGRF